MLANRFYFISSVFFLAGSVWAAVETANPINVLILIGSVFFLIAATLGAFGKKL